MDTFHIFLLEEKRIYHFLYLILTLYFITQPFPFLPPCRETLQGGCKDKSGAFSLLPTHSTNRYVSRKLHPVKLFFCHSKNAPRLSELRLKLNICKTHTGRPIWQWFHRLLLLSSHIILFSNRKWIEGCVFVSTGLSSL